MQSNSKKLFYILGISIAVSSSVAYCQPFSRSVILHRNRKDESLIQPSPLASGYDSSLVFEKKYKMVPGVAMRRNIERVFGRPEDETFVEELEEPTAAHILGNSSKALFENVDNLLQELEIEARESITKQRLASQAALIEQRKVNIASYAADVEAKKKRDEEAKLAAYLESLKPKDENYNPEDNSYDEPIDEPENFDEDPESVVISTQGNKISVKSPKASTTESATPASSTPPLL